MAQAGRERSLDDLSDGQRSLFHLAMTAATLDVEARGAGVIVSHDERGNIAITPSPSLAGIITELGTSRLL